MKFQKYKRKASKKPDTLRNQKELALTLSYEKESRLKSATNSLRHKVC